MLPGGGHTSGGIILSIARDGVRATAQMVLRVEAGSGSLLWLASQDGFRQYPVQDPRGFYRLALPPDVVEIGLLLDGPGGDTVRMRVDLVETLAKSLHTNYDQIATGMFVGLLMGGGGSFLVTLIPLLLRKTIFGVVDGGDGPAKLIVDILLALWTAMLTWLLLELFGGGSRQHEDRDYCLLPTSLPSVTFGRCQRLGTIIAPIILALMPCRSAVKVTAFVLVTVVSERLGRPSALLRSQHGYRNLLLLVAALPMLMECAVEVRNLLILLSDVGVAAVLKELHPVWTLPVEILCIAAYRQSWIPAGATGPTKARIRQTARRTAMSRFYLLVLSLELDSPHMMVGGLLLPQVAESLQ